MGTGGFVHLLARSLPVNLLNFLISSFTKFKFLFYAMAAFPHSAGWSPIQNPKWRRRTLESIKSQKFSVEAATAPPLYRAAEFERILEISRDCFQAKGIYPISFSIPLLGQRVDDLAKQRVLSRVFPGEPYAFDSFTDYVDQYSTSVYGLTHKKGGWDCFRHLEIISAGSLPLMPDVRACPEFTMVHYPKSAMLSVLENYKRGALPGSNVNSFFYEWSLNHLTSKAMVKNIFEVLGLAPKRVLFIDELLPERADYLSVLTLIGLMQSESYHVDVAFPVDYIFSDWQGDAGGLYGRGFGYSKVFDRTESRTPWCSTGTCASPPKAGAKGLFSEGFDTLVVGDISANLTYTKIIDAEPGMAKKIYLRGDDLAPTANEYRWLRSLSGSIFSREIY